MLWSLLVFKGFYYCGYQFVSHFLNHFVFWHKYKNRYKKNNSRKTQVNKQNLRKRGNNWKVKHFVLQPLRNNNYKLLKSFFSNPTGILTSFCLFWLQWNMFTTLRYLLGFGVVTFFSGNSMLSCIAAKRKEWVLIRVIY